MSERRALKNKELIAEIVSLCRQQASGTVFIATAENRQSRIVLIDGEIVCASMHRLDGVSVIRTIASLESGIFGFNPDLQLVTSREVLPDTETLLQILQQSGGEKIEERQPVTSVKEGFLLPARSKILEILVHEATEYLGPMATIICQDYVQQLTASINPSNVQQLIRQVEKDINNTDKAQKFRAAVMKRLGL